MKKIIPILRSRDVKKLILRLIRKTGKSNKIETISIVSSIPNIYWPKADGYPPCPPKVKLFCLDKYNKFDFGVDILIYLKTRPAPY